MENTETRSETEAKHIQQISILTDNELSGLAKHANPGTQLHSMVAIETTFRKAQIKIGGAR